MSFNHLRFCKFFCDKYHDKYYPKLSDDMIADIVDFTLNVAPYKFFSYSQVQEHPEFCKQCGMCCGTIDCQYFNGRTCEEYATRMYACTEFPYHDVMDGGLILDPGCQFAMKLAEMVLDKEFEEKIEFYEVD